MEHRNRKKRQLVRELPSTTYRLHFSCEHVGRYLSCTKRRIKWWVSRPPSIQSPKFHYTIHTVGRLRWSDLAIVYGYFIHSPTPLGHLSLFKLMAGLLDSQICMLREKENLGINAGGKNMKWNLSGLYTAKRSGYFGTRATFLIFFATHEILVRST